MSRLPAAGRGEPIEVVSGTRAHAVATPQSFWWRERRYDVAAVLDHWVESGLWWRRFSCGEAIVQLHWWRVETLPGHARSSTPGGVYDLCWDEAANRWVLGRVHD